MLFSLVSSEVFQIPKAINLAEYTKIFTSLLQYTFLYKCENLSLFLLLRKVIALYSSLKFSAAFQFCLVYMLLN